MPLILEIHGGPFAAYGPHFSTDNQLYAAAGYAVLSVNPRGSTSYGEEFANLIHHAYPGRDYDDLMAAVDAAIAGGYADPDRLFVTGGSGGGVLTAWIVGKTDRFKAAATQKPVIDWTSFALTADGPAFFSRYWFGKYPWEDHEAFWTRSPLSLVGNVKTPTLVVVGSQDYRTPVSEAEQYYTALQLRGRSDRFGQGARRQPWRHRRRGPRRPAAKAAAIIAWFDKYKEGAAAVIVIPAKAGTSSRKGAFLSRGPGFRRDDGLRRPPHHRVGEPGARLALGFGDLAGGHLLGDLGPAFLAALAAVEGGEVEPFVRFDEVDLEPVGAGRVSDAELVERVRIAHGGVGEAAFDQESRGFQTVPHVDMPLLLLCRGQVSRSRSPTNG